MSSTSATTSATSASATTARRKKRANVDDDNDDNDDNGNNERGADARRLRDDDGGNESSEDGLLHDDAFRDAEPEEFALDFEFFDAVDDDFHGVKAFLNGYVDPAEFLDSSELAGASRHAATTDALLVKFAPPARRQTPFAMSTRASAISSKSTTSSLDCWPRFR